MKEIICNFCVCEEEYKKNKTLFPEYYKYCPYCGHSLIKKRIEDLK